MDSLTQDKTIMPKTTLPKRGARTFRPRARLLLTLGEEHISSEKVALLELVKNAYDADATRVLVRFHGPLEMGKGAIEVIDNGHGMALETIQSSWMEPATIIKKRNPRSERRGRRVLGEKGIGRFATSRLANSLELVTRRAEAEEEIRLTFDWRQLDEEKYLDEVQFFWESAEPKEICVDGTYKLLWGKDKPPSNVPASGTLLRMKGLRAVWGKKQLEEVRNSLARLVSPFLSDNPSDEFQIRLELPALYKNLSGLIGPSELLRNPHYALKGEVSETGSYHFTITWPDSSSEGLGMTPEAIKGQWTFKNQAQPQCGPFHLELRVWDRSPKEEAHQYGSTLRDFRQDLVRAAGVSIYRDGFRVLPYGERDNDWLGLASRHDKNPTLRLAPNQVMGIVLISADKNPQLRDQSNREGLLEGPALLSLREIILMALSELERRRYHLRLTDSENAAAGGLFTDLTLSDISDLIKERHPEDSELLALVGYKEKNLEEQLEEVQESFARYQRLATLGKLIDTVFHDGQAPLAHIRNQAQLGIYNVHRDHRDADQLVQRLVQRFDRIDKQADVLADFFRKIEPFSGRKRRQPVRIRLEKVIADAFAVLEAEIARGKVRVSLSKTDIKLTVDPTDIQTMIVNLLQNSLYALSQVPKNSRKIMVQVKSTEPEEVVIIFSDSGKGVKPLVRTRIFDPYFSTKQNGVGLGLAIVRDIVKEYYAGRIELIDGGPLLGATFRITLRQRSKR
jgi:signal transduction histidine kinase